jgi:hypothetical protein
MSEGSAGREATADFCHTVHCCQKHAASRYDVELLYVEIDLASELNSCQSVENLW